MPDGDDFNGISQVIAQMGELIEEDIPDAGSDDEAKGQEENEILKQRSLKSETAGPWLNPDKEVRGEEAEQVHEAIPADLNRADLEQRWTYVGKG